MRFILIFVGVALIERFHWLIYLFGAFLVYTGWRMAFGKEKEFNPKTHPVFTFGALTTATKFDIQ